MATNIPAWMSESWQMTTMNGSSLAATFGVAFDTSDPLNVKVVFQDGSSTFWGILTASSVTATASTVSGATSSGQPFHIDYTSGALQCYLDDAPTQRRVSTRGLGRIVATASPQVGARIVASQDGGGGSTPTWVASDPGTAGRGIGKPGGHPIVRPLPDAARA
jgi:hypothetical protein